MHHGHYIAQNIHQSIMRDAISHEPKFQELVEAPPMIGLAVGKKAVAYGPEVGTSSGTDVMEAYFRNDLGFGSKFDLSPMILVEPMTDLFSLLGLHAAWKEASYCLGIELWDLGRSEQAFGCLMKPI